MAAKPRDSENSFLPRCLILMSSTTLPKQNFLSLIVKILGKRKIIRIKKIIRINITKTIGLSAARLKPLIMVPKTLNFGPVVA